MEEYKTIIDFEDYEVSNYGNVRKVSTGELLKQTIYKEYLRVDLFKNWDRYDFVQKTIDVHRLVALTFIPNPLKKRIVDHINRNKLNNHIENLRWATHSQNGMNRTAPKNNTTGQSGVRYIKKSDKWEVTISINKKEKYIGRYSTFEEAVKVRKEQEAIHYKEFQAFQSEMEQLEYEFEQLIK